MNKLLTALAIIEIGNILLTSERTGNIIVLVCENAAKIITHAIAITGQTLVQIAGETGYGEARGGTDESI